MSRVENQRPTVKEAVFTFGVLNNRVFSKGSKGQIERPKLYGITCCLGKFRDNLTAMCSKKFLHSFLPLTNMKTNLDLTKTASGPLVIFPLESLFSAKLG